MSWSARRVAARSAAAAASSSLPADADNDEDDDDPVEALLNRFNCITGVYCHPVGRSDNNVRNYLHICT